MVTSSQGGVYSSFLRAG